MVEPSLVFKENLSCQHHQLNKRTTRVEPSLDSPIMAIKEVQDMHHNIRIWFLVDTMAETTSDLMVKKENSIWISMTDKDTKEDQMCKLTNSLMTSMINRDPTERVVKAIAEATLPS